MQIRVEIDFIYIDLNFFCTLQYKHKNKNNTFLLLIVY